MNKRTLGQNLEVSALGLGCMGMSQAFPPFPPREQMISLDPDGRRTRRHASSTPPRSTGRSRTRSSSARRSNPSATRS